MMGIFGKPVPGAKCAFKASIPVTLLLLEIVFASKKIPITKIPPVLLRFFQGITG
jgi:hypothetical protein